MALLTRVVEHNGAKVVLGRATNLSALMYYVYTSKFRAMIPEIAAFIDKSQKLQDEEWEALPTEVSFLFNKVLEFIIVAQDIQYATGLPFRWPRVGELPDQDKVQSMFSHYMTDTSGLWQKLEEAHAELLAPLTTPEQQPPEARGSLAELDKTDPNLPGASELSTTSIESA